MLPHPPEANPTPDPADAQPPETRADRVRWGVLLALMSAFAILTAWTYNLGAYAHDAAAEHVPRGLVFSNAISDGFLYPRWVQFLHLGLGSPLFTFQPPLPYYGMDVLDRFLALGHPLGWRILIAAGLLTAFLGMYFLVRELTDRRWPALLAAVAYLYAPYVLRNALERGSNEAFGMFLYPWVLWGLIWLARRPTFWRFLAATLLWAACIGMHVLAPLILAPVTLVVALLMGWRQRTLAPLLALLLGGLLMTWVWLPMVTEQHNVHVERDFNYVLAIPEDNPIPLDRLLAPPAIFDTARDNNNVGDRIGLVHTLLLFAGVLGTAYALIRKRYWLGVALGVAVAVGVFLLWMMTPWSYFLWVWFEPLLYRVQYRTRLMGVQALGASAAAGLLIALLSARWQKIAALTLSLLLLLIALPTLYVDLQHRFGEFDNSITLEQVRQIEWDGGGTSLTAFDEFMPKWRNILFDEAEKARLGQDFDAQERPLAQTPAGVSVTDARVTASSWDLTLSLDAPQLLTLNLIDYPRWQALLDGQPHHLQPQQDTGLVQVQMPAGEHHLALRYATTDAERIAWLISLLVVAGLLAAGVWWQLRGRQRKLSPEGGRKQPGLRESAPPLWLLAGLAVFLLLKLLVLDPHTTAFRCQSTSEKVCGAQVTTDVVYPDGGAILRGFAISTDHARPGDVIHVRLYWEAQLGMADPIHSFVHIRNPDLGSPQNPREGNWIWAQEDHETLGGLPTRELVPGKLYLDEFRIALPPDIPPAVYDIRIGLLDAANQTIIYPDLGDITPPLSGRDGFLILPPLTVEP